MFLDFVCIPWRGVRGTSGEFRGVLGRSSGGVQRSFRGAAGTFFPFSKLTLRSSFPVSNLTLLTFLPLSKLTFCSSFPVSNLTLLPFFLLSELTLSSSFPVSQLTLFPASKVTYQN